MAKFNAHGLAYTEKLPPFLAALRGQYAAETGDGPDRVLAAQRRPVKPRSASEEAEDAPLVLDDRGDVVAGVAFGKDGAAKAWAGGAPGTEGDGGQPDDGRPDGGQPDDGKAGTDRIGIGAAKKRRAGKAVGASDKHGDGDGDGGAGDGAGNGAGDAGADRKRKRTGGGTKTSAAGTTAGTTAATVTTAATPDTGKPAAAKKKKRAKIQLSFENDEDQG